MGYYIAFYKIGGDVVSSNFSGVIASLQQIEIAINELTDFESNLELIEFSDIKAGIKGFFADPSGERAIEILEALNNLSILKTSKPLLCKQFKASIIVDGVKTTLEDLTQELTEVIEDLDE